MTTINENGIDVFTCKYCEMDCEELDDFITEWKQKYLILKEEFDYWKKYKHLDFEKLGEDEDYWDCVVQEHNLKKCCDECDNPNCSVTNPEGEEYKRFCKYFPRPKYDSDSD
jgi:Fe-S-cluster-containing dehydrogenase component